MSSSEALFEASSVYFQYVHENERTAHVKTDHVSLWSQPAVGWFSTAGVLLMKIKRNWEY